MRAIRVVLLIGICLISLNVSAKIQFFPDIPRIPLIKSNFAEELATICGNVSSSKTDLLNLQEGVKNIFGGNFDNTVSVSKRISNWIDKQPSRNDDAGIVAALLDISDICTRVSTLTSLTDADWQQLRQLRKHASSLEKISTELMNLSDDIAEADTKEKLDTIFNEMKAAQAQGSPQSATTALSGQGLQSKLINGLAKFINDRAKAEAALYLQKELKKKLCDTDDTKLYFGNLCMAFSSVDSGVSLQAMGTFLKNAAQKDIDDIPGVLINSQLNNFESKKEPLVPMLASYAIYKELKKGRDILDILRGFSELPEIACETKSSGEKCVSLKNLRFMSTLVRAIEQQNNIDVSEIHIGYFVIATLLSLEEILLSHTDKSTINLQKEFKEITLPVAQVLDKLVQNSLTIVKNIKSFQVQANNLKADAELTKVNLGLDMTSLAFQLIIENAKYIDSIADTSVVYDKLFLKVKNVQDKVKMVNYLITVGEELLKEDAFSLFVGTLVFASTHGKELAELGIKLELPENLTKMMPLIIEIANAKSSSEVAATLEAAAAPVGSYKEKAKRNMRTINAFVGGSWGREHTKINGQKIKTHSYGAFAPVGIHFTRPTANNKRYWGGFISLVDLGTLATKRTKDEIDSDVGFDQIVSPGLFATLGFKSLPLNIGFGVSAGNNTVSDKMNSISGDSTRLHLFIALDITMFIF